MTPVENVAGGFLFGAILVAIFLGANTHQAWLYFTKFPKDQLQIKVVVLFLTSG